MEYHLYNEPNKISEEAKNLALQEDNDDNDFVLAQYVIRQHWEEGYKTILFDQVVDGVALLKTQHILDSLTEKGLVTYTIDEYGEKRYSAISE